MLAFNKILVPSDSAAGAEAALQLRRFLPDKEKGVVYVVHVARSAAEARDFEAELRASTFFEADGGGSVRIVTAVGQRPSQAILRLAAAEDVDMILMGKHGSRTTDRLLTYLGAYGQVIGSTAEYVVRTSTCPVLLTSPRFVHSLAEVRRILMAIDFSQYTPAAIRLGRELGRMFNADVEYLHVRDGGDASFSDSQEFANNGSAAEHFEVEHGSAERVILDHVNEKDVDLLAIHSHGHTGDRRARIGHVAEKLIQSAPCSILTVKSFGKSLVSPDKSDKDAVARMLRRAGIP